MKEIGGYLELETLIGKEYYPELIAVNSAANGLIYLIRAKKIKKIYMPFYLCDSVANACNRAACKVEYYHIDKNFMPLFDKQLEANEYLYIVNYFGQISNSCVSNFKEKFHNVIFDNVQAFFQKPIKGIDTIYSCRKFFGVPDGGYVSSESVKQLDLDQDISMDRMKHLLGRFEKGIASDYYNDYKENESAFEGMELRYMSKLTHNILGAIDYEGVFLKRNKNFKLIEQELGSYNELKLSLPEGAYAYPFYCKEGMKVKKQLAQSKIYVPTLWPNVLELENSLEKDYAENILPLPCDQRYNESDMLRMIGVVKKHMN